MSLQFISDSAGETTGVFIPIEEWNSLKNQFKGIEQAEIGIHDSHIRIVRARLTQYEKDPAQAIDFDEAINDIEKGL
ncbi:hypothetical protein [Mucilaginibacter phyllosphaerae]